MLLDVLASGPPFVVDADRVIVRDRFGRPLAVVLDDGRGAITIKSVADADFPRYLEALGLGPAPAVELIGAPRKLTY